jgi:hypothetical protein
MANNGETIEFFGSNDPEAAKRVAARRAETKRRQEHPGLSLDEAADLLELDTRGEVSDLIAAGRLKTDSEGLVEYDRALSIKRSNDVARELGGYR